MMHPEIELAKRRCAIAQQYYDDTVARVQSECPHPERECFESDYTLETFTNGCGMGTSSTGRRPYIVCRLCGYAECAWHGKRKLNYYGLPTITLEQADGYRVGIIHDRENTPR